MAPPDEDELTWMTALVPDVYLYDRGQDPKPTWPPWTCKNCGTENPYGNLTCSSCGLSR